jgi:NTP pyrophosphatase (non-canonical NTP hydrolase)
MSNESQLFADLLHKEGEAKYLRKVVEELTELQLAVLHYQDGKAGKAQIEEEIADIALQIHKLVYFFNIDVEELDKKLEKKVSLLEDIVYYDPNYKN